LSYIRRSIILEVGKESFFAFHINNKSVRKLSCEELRKAYEEAIKHERMLEEAFKRLGEGIREKGYLEPQDLVFIYAWKAPATDLARGTLVKLAFKAIESHGVNGIRQITEEAIELAKQDRLREVVEKLDGLHGADVRVSSAIITCYDPSRFAVVDWKAWKALYGKVKDDFTSEDYVEYLRDVRKMAEECGMTPREVDLALWKIGERSS